MYHLFAWEDYEHFGGLNDYIGSYPTIEAAQAAFNERNELDCAHIGTLKDGALIGLLSCDRSNMWNYRDRVEWKPYIDYSHEGE